jgi:hypothetical protein
VLDVLDHPVIAGPYPRRRRGKSARRHGETLTVLRLGLPPTPARTFRSTNAVESMISICRDHASNVKRWRDGQVALRWCAVGTIWAGKQFRRASTAISICAPCATRWDASPNLSLPPAWMRTSKPPNHHRAAAEVLRDSGQPLLVAYGLFADARRGLRLPSPRRSGADLRGRSRPRGTRSGSFCRCSRNGPRWTLDRQPRRSVWPDQGGRGS